MTKTMQEDLKAEVVAKLKAARASFEDDLKSDHEALGHILSVLEDSAGIERPGDAPAESGATSPSEPQAA